MGSLPLKRMTKRRWARKAEDANGMRKQKGGLPSDVSSVFYTRWTAHGGVRARAEGMSGSRPPSISGRRELIRKGRGAVIRSVSDVRLSGVVTTETEGRVKRVGSKARDERALRVVAGNTAPRAPMWGEVAMEPTASPGFLTPHGGGTARRDCAGKDLGLPEESAGAGLCGNGP